MNESNAVHNQLVVKKRIVMPLALFFITNFDTFSFLSIVKIYPHRCKNVIMLIGYER